MELMVWVEGIQRIVCGVTETTTCQDVVYALAHATAQTGRFTLIERWRNNERLLAPNENPLKILMKWGEYSSEVQLILQRSASDSNKTPGSSGLRASHSSRRNNSLPAQSEKNSDDLRSGSAVSNSEQENSHGGLERNRDSRKSLTYGSIHGTVMDTNSDMLENIAIVQPTLQQKSKDLSNWKESSTKALSPTRIANNDNNIYGLQKKTREVPPYRDPPGPASPPLRSLPPYRDPPPPNVISPGRNQQNPGINTV